MFRDKIGHGMSRARATPKEREGNMGFSIAERWFEFETMTDGITKIWEPHVIPLMQCNIWHVRGRDRDLIVDTGMGIVSLEEAARHLFGNRARALATLTH